MTLISRVAAFAGRWFALLVLVAAAAALVRPEYTAPLAEYTSLFLGVIMFGMGLTLRPADFAVVVTHPKAALIGIASQYTIMPLAGWGIAHALGLPPLLVVGMILVGAAPGGTASNVIVYLARGDVALSVAMTSVSTMLAPLVTPLVVLALAGRTLEVPAGEMFGTILGVVLVPVLAGLALRTFADRWISPVLPVLPLVSVVGIMLVVVGVVGANADDIVATGALVALAVVLHNAFGLALGYFIGRLGGLPEPGRRALGVEVGMQNSGLAAALATTHFSPLAALPGALFSVWHNVSGALLATYWSRRAPDEAEGASRRQTQG
ncbi:bile acid:sodium symporter family protein [Nocardiopsis salina]|uniref:bile acid:sodium symporter family protein n=1 Tax=Nocardiopsis salina TaxID=245836 RepID=UPI000347A54D|nr:bile acid:sodium symporter family protein [Nocardiopsis salina]